MAMRRACSCQISIKTPNRPDSYSVILVTIQQDGVNLISKGIEDLTWDETYVIVQLNQEETKQFTAGIPAYVQIRCYNSEYDAPGSACWPLEVYPSLDDQILGGGV